MAIAPAIASGPIFFLDTATGRQVSLPLRDVFFDTGVITATGSIYTAYQALLDTLLPHLASTGQIVPGPPPPVNPVMVIRAKQAGAKGNFIVVDFGDFDYTDPTNPEFNVSIDETDTYTGLTPATVQQVLGSAAGGGTSSGLVFVPNPAPVATALPQAGTYPLLMQGPAAEVTIPLNGGPGDAFTVQARENGADGALTSVEINDVNLSASTFTLVASWSKDTSSRITAADVETEFAYEIEVDPPAGGGATVGAPAPGTVILSGGADAAAAQLASATVSG
jgi:hypothetical protein